MKELYTSKGFSHTLLGLSCLLLASCSVNETEYERNLEGPQSYGSLVNKEASLVTHEQIQDTSLANQQDFFKIFQDQQLNELIAQALKNNHDLKKAYLNLKQAKVDLGLSKNEQLPSLNASLSSNVRKDLDPAQASLKSSSSNLSVAYELDLFNRLEANERSRFESFKASAFDYHAMRLSIIEQTCQSYWQYAFAKEALHRAEEQLKVSQKRLDLIAQQMQYGAADGLAYDRALVNHRNIEQSVYQRGYELNNAHNALTTLLGEYTESNLHQVIDKEALERRLDPNQQIGLTIPANLLQQRPDLMATEARLRASLANVDEAKANFYPSFNISASLSGSKANELISFFTNPVVAIGATIAFPFLDYQKLSLREESALVDYEKAQLAFVDSFVIAVKEVAEALNSLSYQELLNKSANEEFKLTKQNYERYLDRYRIGSADLADVLDASDSLRNAEIKLLSSKRDLLNATIRLMIALGGDFASSEIPELNDKRNDALSIS